MRKRIRLPVATIFASCIAGHSLLWSGEGVAAEPASATAAALSTAKVGKIFDRAAYGTAAGKAAYLAQIDPDRLGETAQPGPGVTSLERISPPLIQVKAGKSVELVVKTAAGMPVSLHAADGGRFANGKNVITVAADDRGRATIIYTATADVVGYASIRAASPSASNTILLTVQVLP